MIRPVGVRRSILGVLVSISLAACGGSESNDPEDGGLLGDAGSPSDAGHDAGYDAGMDAGVDAGIDGGVDGGVDGGYDAGVDAGYDAGVDAGFDAGVDSGLCDPLAIEVTPTDVGSTSTREFSTLPSDDPSMFGFGAGEVRSVDFDALPDGTPVATGSSLTTEYASLGVTMSDIRVYHLVYGGAASDPNATEDNEPQIFTFSVPVVAAGIINTSPDRDTVQLWSGPDGTGDLLLEFRDQEMLTVDFNIDRFVGGVACPGTTIGSIVLFNATGDLELDELVFELEAP